MGKIVILWRINGSRNIKICILYKKRKTCRATTFSIHRHTCRHVFAAAFSQVSANLGGCSVVDVPCFGELNRVWPPTTRWDIALAAGFRFSFALVAAQVQRLFAILFNIYTVSMQSAHFAQTKHMFVQSEIHSTNPMLLQILFSVNANAPIVKWRST